MKIFANLHTHTTHSDGVWTPKELVEVAKKEGYGAIAVTDHDTVSGYSELASECEKQGLKSVFGCEFSSPCASLATAFHIVGFNFSQNQSAISRYLEERSFCETYQTKVLFERGLREGLISGIDWDEVLEYNKGITWLCNEHVFRAMKAKGLKKDTDYPEFFNTVYGDRRGEVKLPYNFMPLEQILTLIHDAGGLAILAHPTPPYGHTDRVDALVKMGIDGIEVWHHELDNDTRKRALELALKYDLFISGGSDHSGLCGGQYRRYANPKESEHYAPELSLGTTKEFFEEIVSGKKLCGRKELIEQYIREYP